MNLKHDKYLTLKEIEELEETKKKIERDSKTKYETSQKKNEKTFNTHQDIKLPTYFILI
jgi:hypothetical protein